jgi:lipopolysaccharide transport system permease protein
VARLTGAETPAGAETRATRDDREDARRAIVIEPRRMRPRLARQDIWEFRDLFYFLVWRDVKVRYSQAAFGVGWAVLQPLLLMTVFALFLGELAGVPSEGLPYPLFAYAALVPWTLFSQALSGASESLVRNADMISKVYFPRIILPLAAAVAVVPDFLIALSLIVVMMVAYDVYPSAALPLLPVLGVIALVTASAVGTLLSALNVRYRDVRHALPLLLQLWLFASPVAYPSTLVPEEWRPLYALNPMSSVIDGFRWSLFGTEPPSVAMIAVSVASAATLLVVGLAYFRHVERSFADVI